MVTKLDRAVLTGYAISWEAVLTSVAEVGRSGQVIRRRLGTPVGSPFQLNLWAALKSLRNYASELGCSGSSRSRVHAVLAAVPDDL